MALATLFQPLTGPIGAASAPRSDPMKERTLTGFGVRLTALRQARGLTQEELGAAVGVSNRMIAYYERDGAQPPGAMLVDLAQVLRCSTDALLGVTAVGATLAPKTARLLKRLQRIEELPPADQRAVPKLVDAMLDTRRRSAPPPRAKRKAS
jgi:transcriptional regulator with XRE-family HTH domain